MQVVAQPDLIQHPAFGRQQRQIGPHVGQVQLCTVGGIGLDAAIGHHQTAIGQRFQIMWTDALTVPFRDAGKARRLPDTDPPGGPLGHNLRGDQLAAIGGKHAVAVELAAKGRGKVVADLAGQAIDHQRKAARTPRKGHRQRLRRMGGGGMATGGQRQLEQALPGGGQAMQHEVIPEFAGGKTGRAAHLGPGHPRQAGGGQSGQKGATCGHVNPRPPR